MGAYASGARGWDVVLGALGGAVVGGALGFATGLGMMAGTAFLASGGTMASTATVATLGGINISAGAAFLIAAGAVGVASVLDYSISAGIANEDWNPGKAVASFITGSIFGAAAFGVGFALGGAGLGLGKVANFTDLFARESTKLIFNSIALGGVRWITNQVIRNWKKRN